MIDHDSGRFRRYIAVLSDGHPDSGGHHRRRVVHAIAHIKCLRFSRLLADDVEFFFGTLLSTDLGDAQSWKSQVWLVQYCVKWAYFSVIPANDFSEESVAESNCSRDLASGIVSTSKCRPLSSSKVLTTSKRS